MLIKTFGLLLKAATVLVLGFLTAMRYIAEDREVFETLMWDLYCRDDYPYSITAGTDACSAMHQQLTVGDPVMLVIALLFIAWLVYLPGAWYQAGLERRLRASEK